MIGKNCRRLLSVFTSVSCLILSGCETTEPVRLSTVSTCAELDMAADQAVKDSSLPFMYTQLSFPGDWRTVERNPSGISRWVREGSLRRIFVSKKEFFQIEGLSFDAEAKQQGHHRFRISSAQCKQPSRPATLHILNFAEDDPKPYEVKKTVQLKGSEAHDKIARILCGYEDIPAKDAVEELAQKWRSCHTPQ
jgi:hypothetical protein